MKSKTATQPVNHRSPWRTLLGMVASLFMAHALSAQATITVTSLNDSGPGSLRQAIADAAPGETIDFTVTGTVTLTSGELVITNDLTISGPGATNLTVSGNNASRVFSLNSVTAAISGLTIAKGSAYTGGGILNNQSTLTVSNSILTGNQAVMSGGGLANSGTLDVISSTILANVARQGGGIVSSGVVRLTNSTVSGNTSFSYGGGGLNTAVSAGNAIINSTICSNWGGGPGGGIHMDSGTLDIRNSIVADNDSYYHERPDCFVQPQPGTQVISEDYNLIGNTNGCTITGLTTHNIYGKDPLLGPLADNGGPTPTHALLPGSPAIDHGSSGGLATDQRGHPRIFNFPAYFDADDGSDIGAYELQERAQTGPVFTVNSNDDVDDGVPGIAHCSLREAMHAANANPGTNTINFATGVPGLFTGVTGTITLTNGELAITNSVNINGPGAPSLRVSGNNASRVFSIIGGDVSLCGLAVANGRTNGFGGGICNLGTLTVSNCVISECFAGPANWYGGGIYNAGTLSIISSAVSNNAAGLGGGIHNAGNGLIRNTTISSNSTVRYTAETGGGISSSGYLTLADSTVASNSATTGVGIYVGGGNTVVINCTVSGNLATPYRYGGGGGVQVSDGVVVLTNCTVVFNHGDIYSGGFLVLAPGVVNMRSTIVAGNSVRDGRGDGPDWSGSLISLDYCLVQDTNGCTITGVTSHNIYGKDPLLGPLADLGGPTPTHALRYDSPAIDAGQCGGLTTDQRGLPRPIDSPDIANAEGGDGSDIGAYEADPNLRITGFGKAGGDICLSFNSMWGRTYRVESTDDLPPIWNVLTNGVTGTGGRFYAIDGGAASLPKRFYRTVLLP